MKRKSLIVTLCVLCSLLAIPFVVFGAGQAEEVGENELTIVMGVDMITWDVHDHGNTSTEAIHMNMFNKILQRDANMDLQPYLVTSYENVAPTVWEFNLRDDVYFHNGDQLTAADIKFSLERVAFDDSLDSHRHFTSIEEVEIIDDFTFKIHTDGPQPALEARLALTGSHILPKDYIEEHGWDHFMSAPVGSGPYSYVEWVRDSRVVLEKYEDYFLGPDYTDWEKVTFRSVTESSTRVAELLTGNAQLITEIPPNEWPRVDNNDGTHHVSGDSNRVMLLITKHTEGYPTSDPRVREAIEYAIDNEVITDTILQGAATPTRTRVLPGNFGAEEDLFDTYLYDQDHARDLLAEAGYADGVEITLHSPRGRYLMDSEVAEAIAGMLAEVGIAVNLDILEWSQFLQKYTDDTNEELLLIGLGTNAFDASNHLSHYPTEQAAGRIDYSNSEVDRLYAEADSNMDLNERREQYQEIQRIIAEERPHIFLHAIKHNFGVADSITFTPRLDEMLYAPDIEQNF